MLSFKICNTFYLLFFFSSLSFAKTIAFLDFEDRTLGGKGKEEMDLVISNLFPSERFNLIPREKVNRVLTPTIQKELGVITPEIAWTIGELLDCDLIAIGSIEGESSAQRFVRFSFIEGCRKKDPYLKDYILDLFLSHFGVNCKIEKLISQSELTISLTKEDGVKIGTRFDCLRDGKKIAECEVTSCEPSRSILSVSYAKEKISPFDLLRKSSFELNKTKEFLLINTKPRAEISWKGKEIGESPIIINDKIEGELFIKKEGFEPLKTEIENKSHPYSFLDLSLYLGTLKKAEKRPAGLAVSSIPNNCEVFLDGRLMGLTPLFIPNLEEKVYEVVVRKEGFSEQSQKVLVKGEQDLRVNLYSTSLPKETPIPPKEKEHLSELIFLPTAHCLKKGELEFGLTYPDLFLLKIGLPSNLKTEVRVFGIGAALKYNIIDWLGIDLYYKAYDMENGERLKDKGFRLLGSFPSKFFNIHLGLGYLWKETSSNSQYFLGMDMPSREFNLLAEWEKDRFAFGIHKPLKFFEIKLGTGYDGDEISYNLGIYLKKSQESRSQE